VLHLTPDQVERYRLRRMAPAELVESDDHLAVCPACRGQVLDSERLRSAVAALRDELQAVDVGDGCLSEQRLVAYVDGGLMPEERAQVAAHLETCPFCAESVEDLKAFRLVVAAGPREQPRGGGRGSIALTGLAAAAVLLVCAGIIASQQRRVAALQAQVQQAAEAEQRLRRDHDALAATAKRLEKEVASLQDAQAAASRPAAAVSLADTAGRIVLRTDGRLEGLGTLPAPEESLLRRALTTGRLRVPAGLQALLATPLTLRGAEERNAVDPSDQPFALLAPVGTAVESDTPRFHWAPLADAEAYVVTVYDQRFNPVADSGRVTATEWRPAAPLARDALYTWRVIASVRGRAMTTPGPLAPEARFRVLGASEAAELSNARARAPQSHLLLGALYARAGLLDDAGAELKALADLNPDSRVASELVAQVKALRREDSPSRR
jgi:hypothetical protein